jgi:hypothetical protein
MSVFLAALAAASTPNAAAAAPRCMPPGVVMAKAAPKRPGLHRLNEEPPAAELLAVFREVGGCPVPAVVRTSVGKN